MNTKLSSKKNEKKNYRGLTSTLILLFIVPFFVLGGLKGGNIGDRNDPNLTWVASYQFFFLGVLTLGLIYAVYEITNFIFPKKKNFYKTLILFTTNELLLGLLYLWYCLSILFGGAHTNIGIYFGFLLAIAFVNGIICYFYKEKWNNWFVYIGVIFLLAVFFLALLYVNAAWGWPITFMFILIPVFTDTFAYMGGKKFGKTPAFPKTSPNKTKEGLYIGYAFGISFGIIWALIYACGFNNGSIYPHFHHQSIDTLSLIVIAIIVALVAPFGDLLFSKIKRLYNKKDYSNILPGHGGMLDRIDSHIVAFSIGTLLLMFFTIPPQY